MSRDLPIIMQPAMVLGLIHEAQRAGTGKTNTRRDPKRWKDLQPGDSLWVKETHYVFGRWTQPGLTNEKGALRWQFEPAVPVGGVGVAYLNDFDESHKAKKRTDLGWHMRPSIFMPRKLSRLTLTVSSIKIERLHDISEADAIAEGAIWHDGGEVGCSGYRHDREDGYVFTSPIKSYARLWERINGEGSWGKNPEVASIKFTVHLKGKGK